jgi:hypothetical protein
MSKISGSAAYTEARSLGSDDPILEYARATLKSGGAYRDRTDDLMLAKQPLSQLS